MAISDGQEGIFLSFCNEHEKWRAQGKLSHELRSLPLRSNLLPPSPLLLFSLPIVIVLRSMLTMKDPRNEVGAIVHAVANRALSDHTVKNIFGNVNYVKHYLQGTVVGFFDGRVGVNLPPQRRSKGGHGLCCCRLRHRQQQRRQCCRRCRCCCSPRLIVAGTSCCSTCQR
jgi:hypothetical protein